MTSLISLASSFGAETGFQIATDPDTVRAPDVAFVRRERIPSTGLPKAFWPGAPDLAVEVVSPGDTVEEVDEKVADWLDAGTEAVWMVKPKTQDRHGVQRPSVLAVLTADDEIDGGELLPGFRCRVCRRVRALSQENQKKSRLKPDFAALSELAEPSHTECQRPWRTDSAARSSPRFSGSSTAEPSPG